jgi:hypothetical protein
VRIFAASRTCCPVCPGRSSPDCRPVLRGPLSSSSEQLSTYFCPAVSLPRMPASDRQTAERLALRRSWKPIPRSGQSGPAPDQPGPAPDQSGPAPDHPTNGSALTARSGWRARARVPVRAASASARGMSERCEGGAKRRPRSERRAKRAVRGRSEATPSKRANRLGRTVAHAPPAQIPRHRSG